MGQASENAVTLPEPVATGLLAQKPLAHLLVYALERRLSGTFQLEDGTVQGARIVVVQGNIARVWTSEVVVYLGHVLYEAGALDDTQLGASLAEIAATRALHGQALLAHQIISDTQLATALRQQRLRKLHHTFTLPPTSTFAFYANVDLVGSRPNDVEPAPPLPSVWRGVAANPSWEHVRSTVTALAGRPLRLTGSLEGLTFREAERAAVEAMRGRPTTVNDLAEQPGVDARAAEVLAYFLVISKLADVVDKVSVAAPPSRPSLGPSAGSGEYQRRVSFSIRAPVPAPASVRPSAAPGPISSQPAAGPPSVRPSGPPPSTRTGPPPSVRPSGPPPSTRTGPPSARPGAVDGGPSSVRASEFPAPPASAPVLQRPSIEVEQALAQAEMHFVLGDRHEALNFVKSALTLLPKFPAAMALLAALEATNVREGQEGQDDKLRDILRRLDAVIAVDPSCRRGRYYRAGIRKRVGDMAGAIADLREAVANDPDDVDALRELKICERRERYAAKSGSGGHALTPKPASLLDKLLGK